MTKIKITILFFILSFLPSKAQANTYLENEFGQVTWKTCKLYYFYDGYKKNEIVPVLRYVESISNFTFRKWKRSIKPSPDIDIYYFKNDNTEILGKTLVVKNLKKPRIDDVYISMHTKNKDVLLHEILHGLGLDHSDDPNSLMYPYEEEGQFLTPTDLENIKNIPCGK